MAVMVMVVVVVRSLCEVFGKKSAAFEGANSLFNLKNLFGGIRETIRGVDEQEWHQRTCA